MGSQINSFIEKHGNDPTLKNDPTMKRVKKGMQKKYQDHQRKLMKIVEQEDTNEQYEATLREIEEYVPEGAGKSFALHQHRLRKTIEQKLSLFLIKEHTMLQERQKEGLGDIQRIEYRGRITIVEQYQTMITKVVEFDSDEFAQLLWWHTMDTLKGTIEQLRNPPVIMNAASDWEIKTELQGILDELYAIKSKLYRLIKLGGIDMNIKKVRPTQSLKDIAG